MYIQNTLLQQSGVYIISVHIHYSWNDITSTVIECDDLVLFGRVSLELSWLLQWCFDPLVMLESVLLWSGVESYCAPWGRLQCGGSCDMVELWCSVFEKLCNSFELWSDEQSSLWVTQLLQTFLSSSSLLSSQASLSAYSRFKQQHNYNDLTVKLAVAMVSGEDGGINVHDWSALINAICTGVYVRSCWYII